MLKRFIFCKVAVLYVYRNTKNEVVIENQIEESEFYYLEEFKSIYEIFYKPSVNLQGQFYTTLNMALLYRQEIFKQLENKLRYLNNKYNQLRGQVS